MVPVLATIDIEGIEIRPMKTQLKRGQDFLVICTTVKGVDTVSITADSFTIVDITVGYVKILLSITVSIYTYRTDGNKKRMDIV